MKKINVLIITVCFISMLFIIQSVSGLTANSSNYSVGRFGMGLATSNSSSGNYDEVLSLSEPQGTTKNAKSDNYTSNIGFFNNTPYYRAVSITSYSIYPQSAVQGSIISLSISALNSQSVWANITRPDGIVEKIALSNNDYKYYTANLVGQYTVIFYANNSQGNIASVIDTFDITSSVAPPVTPPSGGGTRTVIEKCTYIWDCTAWSICSDGIQERECKNIGNCTGTEGKPIETRECSDALFDVLVGLNKVEITQNETLKFGINLTETKGMEKIDVQIKYSIIDDNKTEIFSQIETRAIMGNLTYEKEINEIKLKNGKYILRVDILYGNLQRAFAEQEFEVKGQGIEIKEPTSNIQKIIGFLKANYLIIILIILVLIGTRYIKRNRLKEVKFKRVPLEAKPRPFENIKLIGGEVYLEIKPKSTDNIKSKKAMHLKAPASGINILSGLKESINFLWSKHKKYPENSIFGLIDKKVYTESGNYLGKVNEIILGENRIESLKIEIDKKHKFSKKGIIVEYKYVRSIKDVVIIEEEVISHLN